MIVPQTSFQLSRHPSHQQPPHAAYHPPHHFVHKSLLAQFFIGFDNNVQIYYDATSRESRLNNRSLKQQLRALAPRQYCTVLKFQSSPMYELAPNKKRSLFRVKSAGNIYGRMEDRVVLLQNIQSQGYFGEYFRKAVRGESEIGFGKNPVCV